MNISIFEKLSDKIITKSILLCKTRMNDISASSIKLNNRLAIYYDHNKFDNSIEEYTAILHEYYHCEVDAFYNFDDSLQTRKRREYKANKQLVLDSIPIDKLKKLLQANYHKWEIAEEFGVTEETIDLAFNIYKNMKEI